MADSSCQAFATGTLTLSWAAWKQRVLLFVPVSRLSRSWPRFGGGLRLIRTRSGLSGPRTTAALPVKACLMLAGLMMLSQIDPLFLERGIITRCGVIRWHLSVLVSLRPRRIRNSGRYLAAVMAHRLALFVSGVLLICCLTRYPSVALTPG